MKRNKMEKIKKLFKSNRGSEILQVILIAGILLVLVITLFYPQMSELFNNMMKTIGNWFTNIGSKPFQAWRASAIIWQFRC